jgi:hypothetical protein
MVKRRVDDSSLNEVMDVEYKLDTPELISDALGYIVLDIRGVRSLLLRADKVLLNKDSKEWVLKSCMVDAFNLYRYRQRNKASDLRLDLYIKRGKDLLRMSEIGFSGGQFRSIGAKWVACPELRGSYEGEDYLDSDVLSTLITNKGDGLSEGIEEVGFI